MSSYFIKRGAPAERGCIDEEALRRMVAEKRLGQDDLVWIDGRTPGWVRATAVPGLFPEPAPPQQADQPVQEEQKPLPKSPPSRRPFGGKLLILLILLLIGVVAAFLLPRFYATRFAAPPAAPPQPAPPTNSVTTADMRDWTPELANLGRLLEQAKLDPARAVLQGMQAVGCTDPELAPLSEQLLSLEADHAFAQEQRDALGRGQLELAAVDPLVAAVQRLQRMPALRSQVEDILIDPEAAAAQVSQSMAIGLAMSDTNVVAHAMAWVVEAPPTKLATAPFWPLLGQLNDAGQPPAAEALCRALLRADPRNPRLGLELAAQLSAQGREDDALDALKKATKYASKEDKQKAATDPRFTPLRNNRRFTRYLK